MTTFDRLEPRLPELIDELASARVPDYFDDLLQTTAQAPQRPAWSALERWLPMGEIARPLPIRAVPWRTIAIVATLVVLVTAGLLAYAGSHQALPAPFGPARGGAIVYHGPDGAIYAADPVSGVPKAIVSGDQAYSYPLPSRDGRRIFYDHTENGRSQLFVADIDGANAHQLPGTYDAFTWAEWAPDSRQVGIVSQSMGHRSYRSSRPTDPRSGPCRSTVISSRSGGCRMVGSSSPGRQNRGCRVVRAGPPTAARSS